MTKIHQLSTIIKMKIEIVTIGDEILIGQIVDTNSAWMTSELSDAGFEVSAVSSVGDNSHDIKLAIDTGFERSDILLLTGGLGPTKDDITKNTLCEYFDTKLVFSEEVLVNINRIFAHKNYKLNELTKNQAYVPEASTVIQNTVGTAPVTWFEKSGKVLVSMPGVPFEMKNVMSTEIIPRLIKQFSTDLFLKRTMLLSGITESALAMMLVDFENELPNNFSLAYLPSYGLMRLRLSTHGSHKKVEFEKQCNKLKSIIAPHLIKVMEDSIEELLGSLLKSKNYTLSTAESCTGGGVAHKITLVPGASQYFNGSVVAYSNEFKTNLLGVDSAVIDRYGAVSKEVVELMARNSVYKLQSDCAIAISGIAGPDGGTPEKPVGLVWICTVTPEGEVTKEYKFGTSRDENINRAINMSILQLIKMLNGNE